MAGDKKALNEIYISYIDSTNYNPPSSRDDINRTAIWAAEKIGSSGCYIRKNWIFGIVSYKASETDSSIQQVFYKVLHNYADARSLARKEGRSTITFRELVRGTPVENLEGKTGVGMSGQEVPLVMDVEDQDDFFNRNYKIF